MSNELIDMHNRISTEELNRLVRHQLKQIFDHPELAAMLPPLMIWGAPGIGKSSIIRNIATVKIRQPGDWQSMRRKDALSNGFSIVI